MKQEADTNAVENERMGQVYFVFNGYLDRLRSDEALKPPSQRSEIPTVKNLADAIGVHEVTLHNIVNGKVTRLNVETMAAVLDEMWKRGFTPQLSDFLRYVPPSIE